MGSPWRESRLGESELPTIRERERDCESRSGRSSGARTRTWRARVKRPWWWSRRDLFNRRRLFVERESPVCVRRVFFFGFRARARREMSRSSGVGSAVDSFNQSAARPESGNLDRLSRSSWRPATRDDRRRRGLLQKRRSRLRVPKMNRERVRMTRYVSFREPIRIFSASRRPSWSLAARAAAVRERLLSKRLLLKRLLVESFLLERRLVEPRYHDPGAVIGNSRP